MVFQCYFIAELKVFLKTGIPVWHSNVAAGFMTVCNKSISYALCSRALDFQTCAALSDVSDWPDQVIHYSWCHAAWSVLKSGGLAVEGLLCYPLCDTGSPHWDNCCLLFSRWFLSAERALVALVTFVLNGKERSRSFWLLEDLIITFHCVVLKLIYSFQKCSKMVQAVSSKFWMW